METNNTKMLFLLALLSAFPPLSTDMYLPALPALQETWQRPMTIVNLTLSGFFIGFCICMLIYGPLSDKYGRKPPLFIGVTLYTVTSVLSGFVSDIYPLIVLRILQGAGSASGAVVAMAITKDLYEGRERQRILAYMAVIMALAPMLAPILGGFIISRFSWHWVFFFQAVMGIMALIGVLWMKEPLKKRVEVSVLRTMGMYSHLFRNKRYLALVGLFTMVVFPNFAYIGSASQIYIVRFGTSEQVFGYYFALNALATMFGSFCFTRLQRDISANKLMIVSFIGPLVGGLIMYADLIKGPWALALPMAIASFFFGLSRPLSNDLTLQQVNEGVGAASSMMTFSFFVAAAFSMWFISFEWADKIHVIALLCIVTSAISLAWWLLMVGRLKRSL